ncbi:PH domain-containing protein [Plasmodiophora brassicae]|nr:hypothetical protein PBRA_006962 [Plasmodiophora brassicae]
MEGYLYKLPISYANNVRSGWKKRYFILENRVLSYYAKHQAKSPKGSISVANCKIVDATPLIHKEFSFAVEIGPSTKSQYLFMRASSAAQRNEWVEALLHAAARAQTTPQTSLSHHRSAQGPRVLTMHGSANASPPLASDASYRPQMSLMTESFFVLPPMAWTMPNPQYAGQVNGQSERSGKGQCTAGGASYKGDWVAGLPKGRGCHAWPNGLQYTGTWENGVPHGQGRLESAVTKRLYEGEFRNGVPSGHGRYVDVDGCVYEGEFLNGKKNGKGTQTWTNNNVYTGRFLDDQMSGMGVLVTSSGERYEGEFLSGQKSGQGTLTRADGLVISGTFSMGVCVKGIVAYQDGSVYNGPLHKGSVRHGIGVMRWRTGDVYEGSFVDDQLSGQGVLKSANGDRYDGNWQNNLENGEGTMEYANGNRYKGEWRNGKRHGRGEFYYMSGNIFKGEYADGFANGKGMFLYKDGSRFTGMFRAGKKEGNGTFVFADGRTLEGTWVDDQMQGPGVMTYMNGDKYIGEWQNYKWHGNGEFIFENGCRYIAVFENGAFPATGTLVYPNGNRWQGRVDRRGRRQDAGVMTWTNGESFRGAFVDDKRHGEGTMTAADGTQSAAIYDMDRIVTLLNGNENPPPDVPSTAAGDVAESPSRSSSWFVRKKRSKVLNAVDFSDPNGAPIIAPTRQSMTSMRSLSSMTAVRGSDTDRLILPTPEDARTVLADPPSTPTSSRHGSVADSQPARKWSSEESREWARLAQERKLSNAAQKQQPQQPQPRSDEAILSDGGEVDDVSLDSISSKDDDVVAADVRSHTRQVSIDSVSDDDDDVQANATAPNAITFDLPSAEFAPSSRSPSSASSALSQRAPSMAIRVSAPDILPPERMPLSPVAEVASIPPTPQTPYRPAEPVPQPNTAQHEPSESISEQKSASTTIKRLSLIDNPALPINVNVPAARQPHRTQAQEQLDGQQRQQRQQQQQQQADTSMTSSAFKKKSGTAAAVVKSTKLSNRGLSEVIAGAPILHHRLSSKASMPNMTSASASGPPVQEPGPTQQQQTGDQGARGKPAPERVSERVSACQKDKVTTSVTSSTAEVKGSIGPAYRPMKPWAPVPSKASAAPAKTAAIQGATSMKPQGRTMWGKATADDPDDSPTVPQAELDQWSAEDVASWLQSSNMDEFVDDFKRGNVHGGNIRDLIESGAVARLTDTTHHSIVKKSQLQFALKTLLAKNPRQTPIRRSIRILKTELLKNDVGVALDDDGQLPSGAFVSTARSKAAAPVQVDRLRQLWESRRLTQAIGRKQ